MNTAYRLGLDIGTNSLGWAIWSLDGESPKEILDMGVRIFPNGREPSGEGMGASLAVNRREARSRRRRRDRILQRKRVLVNELVRQGLWPDRAEKRSAYSSWDPYELRAKALEKELEPAELGRILLHLAQRRGFKSNRIIDSESDEKGITGFKERIEELKKELEPNELEPNGFETLGKYLNSMKKIGVRFHEDFGFFPDRQLYIDEFEYIHKRQKEYFPELRWDRFYKILFSQRKLKPQEKGKCRFTEEERAHKCLPSTHRFRILQELANIRIIDSNNREKIPLSSEVFDLAFEKLERENTLDFSALRTMLKVDDCEFNLEDKKRKGLSGNETSFCLRKKDHFGDLWDDFDEKKQDEIVNAIMETEEDSKLREKLNKYGLKSSQVDKIVKLAFPRGTAPYSACFHRKCSKIMRENRVGFAKALETLGCDHRLLEEGSKLPYYGEALPESCIKRDNPNQNASEAKFGKIGNPTVHIALNQLRRVVNSLIKRHGKPKEIVLEMSRELKHGRKENEKIISQQAKNQENNKRLDKKLKEDHNLIGEEDREKLRYYEELEFGNSAASCPYCGKVITEEELFNSDIHVEHILPLSRTLDDGRNNKTIAHKPCNDSKKEQSPHEAFAHSPKGFNWQEICSRISNLPSKKKWRFNEDAMERFKSENDGFIQRQLTDNAYIAKAARRYLTSICPTNKVRGVAFRQTAELRRQWGLDCILSKKGNEKNRSDHRHHAVDAAVIGLIDQSMIQSIAEAASRNEGNLRRGGFEAPPFPGGEKGRERVVEVVKSIVPSIKPNHGHEGKLFKETAYGKIRKALLLDTAKLKEDMVARIFPADVREKFEDMMREEGFQKARKAFLKNNPKVKVMRDLWVTSKPITSIKSGDLKEPTYGNNTKGPSDFALRGRLKEYIEKKAPKKLPEVLESYGEEFGIKHIRYIPKNQEIEEIESSTWKGYEKADCVYVDIWKIPDSKKKGSYRYEGVFVSRLEAIQIEQKGHAPKRPHPAGSRLMRLYKDDTIRVERKEDHWIYRIAGFATTQNKIDIQPIFAGDEGWFEKTNLKSLNVKYPPPRGRQNFKSINALWHEYERIGRVTVRCDGSFR